MRCTRLDILTASLAAVAITSPRSATAFDLQTALAIAPLAQYSQSIEDIDSFLFSGLLQQQQPPPVGIPSEHGATTRKLVTKLLKEGRARQLSQDATAAALEARVLTRAQAAEVERHAKEAEECLAAIVEADAATGLNRDALNYELTFMRPTELRFYHRALLTAQAEIDLAYGCFGDDERQAATMLSKRAATATSGPRLTSAERDALVVAALDTLPSPVGTFLTRGDLQRKLDDAYVEKRRRRQSRQWCWRGRAAASPSPAVYTLVAHEEEFPTAPTAERRVGRDRPHGSSARTDHQISHLSHIAPLPALVTRLIGRAGDLVRCAALAPEW